MELPLLKNLVNSKDRFEFARFFIFCVSDFKRYREYTKYFSLLGVSCRLGEVHYPHNLVNSKFSFEFTRL